MRVADDDLQSVKTLAVMRIPSLFIGLVLGFGLSFVVSRFEETMTNNVQVAYFITFVVYMAAAVGSQTQAIYARDVTRGKAKFGNYLIKESVLGVVIGAVFGTISWVVTTLWLGSDVLGRTVGISVFVAVAVAPVVALLITELFELERTDPAVGAGPIATIVQDTISVVVYGVVASWLLLD